MAKVKVYYASQKKLRAKQRLRNLRIVDPLWERIYYGAHLEFYKDELKQLPVYYPVRNRLLVEDFLNARRMFNSYVVLPIDGMLYMFDIMQQRRLKYEGKPSIYTDLRTLPHLEFGAGNGFPTMTNWVKNHTVKALVRKLRKIKNVPNGITIEASYNNYVGKRFNVALQIVGSEQMDVPLHISDPDYYRNFPDGEPMQKLVDLLRQNGFIVALRDDCDYESIYDGAGKCTDSKKIKKIDPVAIAYGRGLKIGFSTGENSLFGYSYGIDNVLWDFGFDFDKWSRCNEIPKTSEPEEVVKFLLEYAEKHRIKEHENV